MTLPASGAISQGDMSAKMGWASTTNAALSWVFDNTKSGQQSWLYSGYYSKNWYQRNADGNCNNGNCNCNCNCGNQNCTNCVLTAINCANCDARAWLQNNCNCACTYNCNQAVCYTINCFCDCY